MKRGLKATTATTVCGRSGVNEFDGLQSLCPDEKGTESDDGTFYPRVDGGVTITIPMKRGLKDRWGALPSRTRRLLQSLCPDEKGTESRQDPRFRRPGDLVTITIPMKRGLKVQDGRFRK